MDVLEVPISAEPWQPPQRVFPSIILGLGEFGRQVIAAWKLTSKLPPNLTPPAILWTSPLGWAEVVPDVTSSDQYASAADWWQDYRKGFGDCFSNALRAVRRQPVVTTWLACEPSLVIDVYIAADMLDPFGSQLIFPILAALPKFAGKVPRICSTLLLACDTTATRLMDPGQSTALRTFLNQLEIELMNRSRWESQAIVGWCYLFDMIDVTQRTLQPMSGLNQVDDGESLRAAMAAEFIRHLLAGLRGCESYCRTSIANMNIAFRNGPRTAWVGAVGVAGLRLQAGHLSDDMIRATARRVLQGLGAGPENPTDLPKAQKLRTRFIEMLSLTPAGLTRQISQDKSGNPLRFFTDPPALRDIAGCHIIDFLLNWDVLLAHRWSLKDGPSFRMSENADNLLAAACTWLDQNIEEVAESEWNGLCTATRLVQEARRSMLEMSHQREQESTRGHWLTYLLARIAPSVPDPLHLPNLDSDQQHLLRELRKKLSPRAMWVRAGLSAVVWTSFLGAAYRASFPVIDPITNQILRDWQHWITRPVALAFIGLMSWTACQLASWLEIMHSESGIHTAISQLIDHIRLKYRVLIARQLQGERDRVYKEVIEHLNNWETRLNKRREVLRQTDMLLTGSSQIGSVGGPFLVIQTGERQTLQSDENEENYANIARKFALRPDQAGWADETPSTLASELYTFCRDWEVHRYEQFVRTVWQVTPKVAIKMLEQIRLHVRPAWSLSEEERARVLNRKQESQFTIIYEKQASPVIQRQFLGLPDGMEREPADGEMIWYEGLPGEILYAVTLHGLDLKNLHAWSGLWDAIDPGS